MAEYTISEIHKLGCQEVVQVLVGFGPPFKKVAIGSP